MSNGRISDPTNRAEFIMYIKALLGHPVIELNVTDFQIDIAVDQALQYFQNYHYLGTTQVYHVHYITQAEINSGKVMADPSFVGITAVYDSGNNSGMGLNTNLYPGGWQTNYDLVFNQTAQQGTFVSYYMNSMYYDMINSIITGMNTLAFNEYENVVYLRNAYKSYKDGDTIIFDGFQVLDPDEHPEVWSDRWLIRYAAAKLKRQWGENISKFDATLPGGVKLNYERIIAESAEELRQIEENMLRDYSESPRDFIG